MFKPTPITLAIASALCLSPAAMPEACAADAPEPRVRDGRFELRIPGAGESNVVRWIEWSTNLLGWEPVARDYGAGWANTFPHAVPIETSGVDQVLVDSGDVPERFFRLAEAEGNGLDHAHSVSRFLQQATFGPTRPMIESFPGVDSPSGLNDRPYTHYAQWIDSQMALPVTSLRAFWRERSDPSYTDNSVHSPFEVAHNPAYGTQLNYYVGNELFLPGAANAVAAGRNANDVSFSAGDTKKIVWYQAALTADDALRQRTAWALSQLFVVGEGGSNQPEAAERWLSYYDIFLRHAFGNYREILFEVTFHPAMGRYLTYTDNRKADLKRGTFPDENYAREVMQLFTIGLWLLNPDGTLVLDADGNPVPTYDNEDIEEFAKVFTGLRRQPNRPNIEILGGNYIDPMRVQVSWHDFSTKTLLDGSTLGPFPETEIGVLLDVSGLLNHLFYHPNTPPFVARRLIQRFTVSNPSPTYIADVARAFTDGAYLGAGTGQRGDLAAVIKAILLHPEAREPVLAADAAHGKLREPLIRLLHMARAFHITSPQTYGLLPFRGLEDQISQAPFDYPSVFNFYLSDYQPVGPVLDRGMYAPEFQIHNDITSLRLPNALRVLVYQGIRSPIGPRGYSQGDLDLGYEIGLAGDPGALLDHLDLVLTAGRLAPLNREVMRRALLRTPGSTYADREARVRRALSLFSLVPEFNVLY